MELFAKIIDVIFPQKVPFQIFDIALNTTLVVNDDFEALYWRNPLKYFMDSMLSRMNYHKSQTLLFI